MGVRIHKLAKELDVPSKELMEMLQTKGIKVGSHLNSIDADVADDLRQQVKSGGGGGGAAAATGSANGDKPSAKGGSDAKEKGKPAAKAPAKPRPKPVKHVPVAPERPTPAPVLAKPRPAVRRPVIARSTRPVQPKERSAPSRRPRDTGGGGGGGGPQAQPGPMPPDPDGKPRGKRVRVFTDGGQLRGPAGGGGQRGRGGGRPGPHGGGGRRGGGGGGARRPGLSRPRRSQQTAPVDRPSEVTVNMPVTLKELSSISAIPLSQIQSALLLEKTIQLTANTNVPEDVIPFIAEKFDVKIEVKEQEALDSALDEIETRTDEAGSLRPRAPVVTLLGHVDHGKTSLLDKIRETRVQMGEHGGITQHLSAYRVDSGDKHVVFIDTPGHQAFTEMRARGANVTDVAVLVVAADDGVMPQTEEAHQHAKAAGISVVVAINKIDKANANVMRTKQQLAEIGLSPPDWGGTTEMVEVSALNDLGIDDLLELLTLETEILELRANPDKEAIGTVLDARATQGLGNVATILIQEGTLRPGDHVICGSAQGNVRTLQSTTGHRLKKAGPSTPIELTGLDELPEAGDRLYALSDVKKLKAIAEDRKRQRRALERARRRQHITLEGLSEFLAKAKIKEVNLIVKADVKGSLEVLRKQLTDLSTDEVGIRIIGDGIGAITESDVLLADASNAVVIGFGVAANDRARRQADESNVEIRTYQVIYQILEEMKLSLEGLLDPELYEEGQASAEVQEVFTSSRLGRIAGCIVRRGVLRRDDPVRLIRDGKVIYEGKLDSLKRFKDDVKEVKEGFDCGCRIAGYNDVKVGDFIESHKILKKARTLDQSK